MLQTNKIRKPYHGLPIDKDWAWIVLIATFINLVVVQGSLRSFGLMFVEIQKYFKASPTAVSVVLSAQWATHCLFAFLVLNCLSNFLTPRILILIGLLLAALCLILDSLATNVQFLPLFHIFIGAGHAFIYGPCFVNIGHYFQKYRGTANALVSCGSSVGQMLFPPFIGFLITEYGMRGAMLLNAAIFLQCIVFALMLRPISFFTGKEPQLTPVSSPVPSTDSYKMGENERLRDKLLGSQTDTNDIHCLNSLCVKSSIAVDSNDSNTNESNELHLAKTESNDGKDQNDVINYQKKDEKTGLCKTDISLHNLQQVDVHMKKQMDGGFTKTKIENANYISFVSNQDFLEREKISLKQRILEKIDLKLFKEKIFIVCFLASTLAMSNSVSPQIYFPLHSRDLGFGQTEGAFFVAISGFADLGGRIITSVIADRKWLNRPIFLGTVLLSHGVIGCFTIFYKTFLMFTFYCFYYGACGGVLFALFPTILMDFIGHQRFSKALGLIYLFNGLLQSVSYVFLGYLREMTESYFVGFGLNSLALIFSGILFLSESFVKYEKNKNK